MALGRLTWRGLLLPVLAFACVGAYFAIRTALQVVPEGDATLHLHMMEIVAEGYLPRTVPFFAAVVRAPLTGIILTAEMTGNFTQILPLMFTCMAATFTAHGLGTKPIYTALLERDLRRIDPTQTPGAEPGEEETGPASDSRADG